MSDTKTNEPQWYHGKDNQVSGPHPESKLRELMTVGEVTSETLVWSDSLTVWTPAGKIEELQKPPQTGPRLRRRAVTTVPPLPAPVVDAAKPVGKPTEKSGEKPAEKPSDKPAEKTAENTGAVTEKETSETAKPTEAKAEEEKPDSAKIKRIGLKRTYSPEEEMNAYTPAPPGGSQSNPLMATHDPLARRKGFDRPWYLTLICALVMLASFTTLLGVVTFYSLPAAKEKVANYFAELNADPEAEEITLIDEEILKKFVNALAVVAVLHLIAMGGFMGMKRWGVYFYGMAGLFGVVALSAAGMPVKMITTTALLTYIVVLGFGIVSYREMN